MQGELEIQYLKCPHCSRVSISLVTDQKLREMIETNQRLLEKARKAKGLKYQKAFWEYKNARHKAMEYHLKVNLIDKIDKQLL